MRVVPSALRFVLAAVVLAVVSWKLLAIGALPIAPHSMPMGEHRFAAQAYSIAWWFSLATALSAAVSVFLSTLVRVRGAKGHRELRFIGDAVTILLFGVAGVSLSAFAFELPISTVLATSSIIAVVLGFALQNTLADLLSGLALSIEQPFRVSDRIELSDHVGGRVLQMNWRATHILSISGDLIVVPNSTLSRGRIINHDSRVSATHRFSVLVKVGNDEPPSRVCEVLRAAAISSRGVLATPAPRVEIAAYGDWAIEYKILFHFSDWGDGTEIASNVFDTVWAHLSWAGIAHPVPRTVLTNASGNAGVTSSLASLLKRIPLFKDLADDDRASLADKLHVRPVPRGTRIITQGDTGSSLFVVREGIFGVRVQEDDGPEREVARIFPGDYVGEASLLTGAPRAATIEAVTGAAVYEIDKGHFEPFLSAHPNMAEVLAASLASRSSERSAALSPVHGAAPATLVVLAGQIRAFFRN